MRLLEALRLPAGAGTVRAVRALTRGRAARSLGVVLAVGAVLAVTACEDDPMGPSQEDLEAQVFDAMNRDLYLETGEYIGRLWEYHDQNPTDHRATFMLAATAMWWIAEAGRPDTNGLQIISQSIPLILENFFDVILNDPENQFGAMALLGAFLYETGFDRAQGAALVDSAAKYVPEVGLFQQMHIRRFAAADDTVTANSIDAGFRWWEHCAGGITLDRSDPDFAPYVQPPTEVHPDNFCWGSERVPHGFEGSWMIFGDLLVKGQQIEAARVAYENARLGPNYDRWKYRSELEARLDSDLAARAATYLNRDPTKWAPIGMPLQGCTQCHASAF